MLGWRVICSSESVYYIIDFRIHTGKVKIGKKSFFDRFPKISRQTKCDNCCQKQLIFILIISTLEYSFQFLPYPCSGWNLISNLVTDYILKRRGEPGLSSFEVQQIKFLEALLQDHA